MPHAPEDRARPGRLLLLKQLAAKSVEQGDRLFPPRPRLPPEYADLKVDWSDFDTFVMGLAGRALSEEHLRPEDVEPFPARHDEVRDRLRRLERDYPDIAPKYVEEFRFLEEMLEILRRLAHET